MSEPLHPQAAAVPPAVPAPGAPAAVPTEPPRDGVGRPKISSGGPGVENPRSDGDAEPASGAVLDVRNLSVSFRNEGRTVQAVKGVSFTVHRGETVALVGESGSGKSVTALSTVQLLGEAAILGGSVLYEGAEMIGAPESRLRAVRGNDISFVFQEPMTSLNPLHTIERQLAESLALHQGLSGATARARIIDLLNRVGIRDAESRLQDYPHQLSGGQRQRVMIAMALANDPVLLIADEPTTALDVTIQAQILELLQELQDRTGTAILLITHDLGVVAETCDDVAVMYAGSVVERAPTQALFADPQHPYTIGLMAAVPRLDSPADRLATIPGAVPPPWANRQGCRFASRCPLATARCRAERPPLRTLSPGHSVACWYAPIEEAAA